MAIDGPGQARPHYASIGKSLRTFISDSSKYVYNISTTHHGTIYLCPIQTIQLGLYIGHNHDDDLMHMKLLFEVATTLIKTMRIIVFEFQQIQ
jgi:hypothetical protein